MKAAIALEGGGKRKKKAEVVEATGEPVSSRGEAEARREVEAAGAEMKQLPGASEGEMRLKEAVGRALEVLNRGGALEERMLEARSLLAEGVKEIS